MSQSITHTNNVDELKNINIIIVQNNSVRAQRPKTINNMDVKNYVKCFDLVFPFF